MENKDKFKMGVYDEKGELVDFGYYETEEKAEEDFIKWDKPKGRTRIIEGI